ncbi:hypothetical protein DOTSEDRAFT_173704 [Dothistroma septosporum NZE10]|uniref:ORC6 first cyclin-like domain-containing protein n=1 Tax=Dothistroma septosporum (strain NZE10 / CBS 128990) TaxID=675120 RepID=M2YMD4_DOTSN|nr:hypothetical protein DOTSEDRAFT_173704 [Dothistroma septosporum NZE10]
MPTPVELALAGLLPTVAFLPPELIALASSLLSQSRAKAASLKPEEEIGRTYACAHIACNRSAKRLDLEVGKPAPPVKPRVYDKLYKYLDSALTTTRQQNAPRTPQMNKVKDVPASAGKSSKRKHNEAEQDDDVPGFAMPMVRAVCKAGGIPAAVPHVMVGAAAAVREIVSRASKSKNDLPSKRRRKTPQSANGVALSKWPALIAALYGFTAARMRSISAEDDEYDMLRKTATEVVKKYCEENSETLPSEVTTGSNKLDSNIKFYALEAEDCGWLEMDWYHNIPEGGCEGQDESEVPESDLLVDDEDEVGRAGLLPGLATMFQPAIDWLSDERRADFAQWKKGIMKEISAIEAKV